MRQFRLVHVGVAAVLAAATVAGVGLVQSVTAATGSPSAFVPITPCRLLDTRTGDINVGTRATPIGNGEAATFAVWGTNGHCTIPSSATGIATNTTAVNATASSYVTVYPADASPRPTASNLNFTAGSAPTPNQVTVGLSAAGAIGVFNLSGTVDIIVDIVGYYQREAGGGGSASGSHSKLFTGVGFAPTESTDIYVVHDGGVFPTSNGCYMRDVDLPDGATVTLLAATLLDSSTTRGTSIDLFATPLGVAHVQMAQISTTALDTPGQVSAGNNLITQPTINNASFSYSLQFCGGLNADLFKVSIDYTLP